MKSRVINHRHFLVFPKGEEVVGGLTAYVRERNIAAGSISAIGAASALELRYYDVDTKEYVSKQFAGKFEIASFTGNVSRLHGEPWPHVHGVFTGTDFIAFGGHVSTMTVGVTCEVILDETDSVIDREKDDETGLHTMCL